MPRGKFPFEEWVLDRDGWTGGETGGALVPVGTGRGVSGLASVACAPGLCPPCRSFHLGSLPASVRPKVVCPSFPLRDLVSFVSGRPYVDSCFDVGPPRNIPEGGRWVCLGRSLGLGRPTDVFPGRTYCRPGLLFSFLPLPVVVTSLSVSYRSWFLLSGADPS